MPITIPKLSTVVRPAPLFKSGLLLPNPGKIKAVADLREAYSEVAEGWNGSDDKSLYEFAEPRTRELLLGTDDVRATHDFDVASMYAHSGNWKMASRYLGYALVKIAGKIKKMGYGYDTCLVGGTKIPLLDGTEVAVSDLVGREQFWVYSLNDKGMLRPGMGHSARLTFRDAPILAVTLDNGEMVKCTSNHPFLMRSGEYKAAELLVPGDSLMPLYRSMSSLESGGNEYQTTYQPGDDSWKFTHRFVEARCPRGYVRHHKDLNRFNNSPDNLVLMLWEDHLKLHQSLGGSIVTEKARMARRANILKVNEKKRGVPLTLEHRQALSEGGRNVSEEIKAERAKSGRKSRIIYNQSEKGRKRSGDILRNIWANPESRKLMREKISAARSTPEQKAATSARLRAEHAAGRSPRAKAVLNHKVVSVVHLGTSDVYDISVDKYHNFALSAGVFVHNSGEVQRGGGTSGEGRHLWDTGNSPKHDHTQNNPANMLFDADAEDDYPELAEFKHKRVYFPPRTR